MPDEIVLLGAHLDSWTVGTGATDNAAGCAVLIEAMRILKAIGVQPKRTIRMALWGGHEGAGRGARSYVRDHLVEDHPLNWLDVEPGSPIRPKAAYEKLSAYYNFDGSGQIRGIYTEGIEGVGRIFESWFGPFMDYGEFFLVNATTGGTDNDEFNEVGLPGFHFVQDNNEYGVYTHHSSMDLFDYLSESDLQRSAIILAFFAYQTAMRDELLPRGKVARK